MAASRRRRLLGALALAGALLSLSAAPAVAADGDAQITHFESTTDGLRMLVSVPADTPLDLSGASVTVDGRPADATALLAKSQAVVRRTAILAIDTSDSMAGARIRAAKTAAHEYIDALPDDVYLGIVTFADDVTTQLTPSQDRAQASSIIDGLTLSHGTKLYDGLISATRLAGSQGQRSLLVLSDGADVGSVATLHQTAVAIKNAKVLADVVAVDEKGTALSALQTIADAAKGDVLAADPTTLQQRFQAEADVLANQVLVTAQLPSGFTGTSAQVTVTLPTSDGGNVVASALDSDLQAAPPAAPVVPAAATHTSRFVIPSWGMYAGAGTVGVGLLVFIVALVPARSAKLSPEHRVTSYAAAVSRNQSSNKSDTDQVLATAKHAAEEVLKRNRGLEARIAARLDAAGSELKAAEWLLLHLGIVLGAGLLGLLIGSGNLVAGILFIVLGLVGPWVYLGLRKGRRQRAFNNVLPDTLQLIAGSLAAGLSLAQAVDTVVREGQEPIATEFKRVLVETRLGVSLEDALEGVAERFDSKDFAWVVMAIKIQRQVGGNLAELLEGVGATMRERQYLRRQVSALAAEGKLSAIVLGALPPIFLLYLVVTNRSYVGVLFTDPRGLIMLVGAALWLGVGVFWMSKLVKVEV